MAYMNKRIWKLEEENAKLRGDIRDLLKAWRDDGGVSGVKKIYIELNEMKVGKRKRKQS